MIDNTWETNEDAPIIIGAKIVEETYGGNVGAATDAASEFSWQLEIQGFFA